MARALDADALLAGERVTETKKATALLSAREFGLKAIRPEWGPDVEGSGGMLYLTQWRLIFTSNQLNRVVGSFSLLLPEMVLVQDVSRNRLRQVVMITTADGVEHRFWILGVKGFLKALESAREAFARGDEGPRLSAAVSANPDRVVSTLIVSEKMVRRVKRARLGRD